MVTSAVQSQQDLRQFLCFQLPGGTLAMLPTQQLVEIANLSLSQIVPIPDVSPSLLGVCNWRGEVLWLADLGHFLGFEPLYTQSLRKGQVNTIIVHSDGQTLGLGVEQVNEMLWCDRTQIQPAPMQHLSPNLVRCIQGCWSDPKGNVFLVLDAEAMMDGLK
jgi:positive phototaxis protein PixI